MSHHRAATALLLVMIAASAAASSHSFITVPPWTFPAEFASRIPIQRTSADRDSEAGLPSIAAQIYG